MKKAAIALAVLTAITITSCTDTPAEVQETTTNSTAGGVTESQGESQSAEITPSKDGFTFTFGGYEIALGSEDKAVIAQIGEPSNKIVDKSCAFPGEDYIYSYTGMQFGTFSITADTANGANYIRTIILSDDTLTTPEGVCVGMEQSEVEAVYGVPDKTEAFGIRYEKSDTSLSFSISGGVVTQITYYLDSSDDYQTLGER